MTIHATILKASHILTLSYTQMLGLGITYGISLAGGLRHKAELDHINVLELKAIEIGIYAYCKNKNFLHNKVMCDHVAKSHWLH